MHYIALLPKHTTNPGQIWELSVGTAINPYINVRGIYDPASFNQLILMRLYEREAGSTIWLWSGRGPDGAWVLGSWPAADLVGVAATNSSLRDLYHLQCDVFLK